MLKQQTIVQDVHVFLFLSFEKDVNFALFSFGNHNEGFIQSFSFAKDHDLCSV